MCELCGCDLPIKEEEETKKKDLKLIIQDCCVPDRGPETCE